MIIYTISPKQFPIYKQSTFLATPSRIKYTASQLTNEFNPNGQATIFTNLEAANKFVEDKTIPTSIPQELFRYAIYQMDVPDIKSPDDIEYFRAWEEKEITCYSFPFEGVNYQLIKVYLGIAEYSDFSRKSENSCQIL